MNIFCWEIAFGGSLLIEKKIVVRAKHLLNVEEILC